MLHAGAPVERIVQKVAQQTAQMMPRDGQRLRHGRTGLQRDASPLGLLALAPKDRVDEAVAAVGHLQGRRQLRPGLLEKRRQRVILSAAQQLLHIKHLVFRLVPHRAQLAVKQIDLLIMPKLELILLLELNLLDFLVPLRNKLHKRKIIELNAQIEENERAHDHHIAHVFLGQDVIEQALRCKQKPKEAMRPARLLGGHRAPLRKLHQGDGRRCRAKQPDQQRGKKALPSAECLQLLCKHGDHVNHAGDKVLDKLEQDHRLGDPDAREFLFAAQLQSLEKKQHEDVPEHIEDRKIIRSQQRIDSLLQEPGDREAIGPFPDRPNSGGGVALDCIEQQAVQRRCLQHEFHAQKDTIAHSPSTFRISSVVSRRNASRSA